MSIKDILISNLKGSRKAFIGDMRLVFLFFLVVPTLMAVAMKYVSIQVCGVYVNVLVSQAYLQACGPTGAGNILNAFNYIIPFWVLGAAVAVLVYAAFLKSSPIMFGAGLLYLIFDVYISFYMSNVFYQIVTTAPLTGAAISFPAPLYIIAYEPVLIGVLLGIYLLVGITKFRSGEMVGGGDFHPTY